MRKYIARKLVSLGVWLCPEAGNIPEADGYVAGKIALGLPITNEEIGKYQKKTDKSWNDSIADLIKARKTRIRIEICKKIDKLIEYKTKKQDGVIAVTGEVKVYIQNGAKNI